MRFPSFTRHNKYIPGIIVLAVVGMSYSLTNHHPIFEPLPLPKTIIDISIPFIPYTIWIYYSYYIIFSVGYLIERDFQILDRYLAGVLFINITSVLVFISYPTSIDRDGIAGTSLEFYQEVYRFLYTVDNPTNCLPSLHVSISLFTAFLFYQRDFRKFVVFLFWALIISISTLTTKQHYLVDVIAGGALALFAYWLSFKRWRFTP